MRKHTYDQHFLKDPKRVMELIGHSNIRKNDTVIDFGAGSGIISFALSRRCKDVVAIENEPDTLRKLKNNLHDIENVTIKEMDMLEYGLPTAKYKVFSNPPFSLTSLLVNKLCFANNPPVSTYLVVQRQFARKIIPSDDSFTSALGVQLYPYFTARVRLPLKKTDYTPPPAIDTVLLEIKTRQSTLLNAAEKTGFRNFVEKCYKDANFFENISKKYSRGTRNKPSELRADIWIDLYRKAR